MQKNSVNREKKSIQFNTGENAVAAGATVYLWVIGGNSSTGQNAASRFLCTRNGIIKNLAVSAQAAPGAAKTYIYTVRVNKVDTAITVTLSGAAATEGQDLVNTVAVSIGDIIQIKLVTLAAASVQTHVAAVEFE